VRQEPQKYWHAVVNGCSPENQKLIKNWLGNKNNNEKKGSLNKDIILE